MKKVFLTGATGVVGSAVLKNLILGTKADIVLLVRGENPRSRVEKIFAFLQINFLENESRIKILNTSAETPLYGLRVDDFRLLAESIDTVFHCAANVNLTQSADDAKATALASIENIVQILKANRACKLEHVSTVGVNGMAKSGLAEDRVAVDRSYFNSYEMSKAYVENRLYSLIDDGFAITIHRPSMVVGDEITGRILSFQIFYFLLRVISGEITGGILPPILSRRLDTIPSNFVGDVLVRSAQTPSWSGRIIHACSGPEHAMPLAQMLEIVQKEKEKLSIPYNRPVQVPFFVFSAIGLIGKSLPLTPKWKTRLELLPQLLNYARQDQIFDCSKSRALIGNESWPNPSSYLAKSIEYFLKQKQKKKHSLGED